LLRRLDEAEKDYARWLASGAADDRDACVSYARLHLIRGNLAAYQDLFKHLLEACEKAPDAGSVWQLARIAALAPCPIADAERIVRLVAARPADPDAPAREVFALAGARFRAEQWGPARAALQDFYARAHEDAWLAHPLLAVVELRLGHHREAREHLVKAKEKLDEHRGRAVSAGDFVEPGWFEYERLYREAERTLGATGGSS
jgi:tetratricopeptide (TPR) repeat protein